MNQNEDESIVDIINGIEGLADAGSVKIFGDIDGQVFQLIPCSREMFGFKVIVQAARDGTTVESAEVAMKGSATCDLKAIKRVAVALRRGVVRTAESIQKVDVQNRGDGDSELLD